MLEFNRTRRIACFQSVGGRIVVRTIAQPDKNVDLGILSSGLLDLADVADIFYFSSVSGAGRGRISLRRKGGGYFYLEIERGGGFLRREAGWCTPAWEGVAGRGGGLNILLRGRNVHQLEMQEILEIIEIVESVARVWKTRSMRPFSQGTTGMRHKGSSGKM